jgi:hypothetical protein
MLELNDYNLHYFLGDKGRNATEKKARIANPRQRIQ